MAKIDLFWQSYLQFEKELIEITHYILVDDKQLEVYSLRLADLIIRVNTEIETLAKSLHKANGNPAPANPSHLMYDSDCLSHLDKIWTLSKKVVLVINPMFCLSNSDNRCFKPLREAHKVGEDGPKWKSSYQAIKHDRANSIEKATVKNLLHAMAALFLLNVYHKGYSEIFSNIMEAKDISTTCGSSIFAVKLYNEGSYDLANIKSNNLDVKESVLILHANQNDVANMREAEKKFNEVCVQHTIDKINQDQTLLQKMVKASNPSKELEDTIKRNMMSDMKSNLELYGDDFKRAIVKVRYIVELNKNQFVDSVKTPVSTTSSAS